MVKVFYIIGASGSGKDSLIEYARDQLPEDSTIAFAHRYITRPANAGGENHIALSRFEFNRRLNSGCFCMHWHSHNTDYGIGNEIHLWMAYDLSVVVNGSRAYLPEAAADFPNLVPIFIQTDPDILQQRLQAKGHESNEEIAKRLAKAEALNASVKHPELVRISNNGELASAGNELVHSLQDLM